MAACQWHLSCRSWPEAALLSEGSKPQALFGSKSKTRYQLICLILFVDVVVHIQTSQRWQQKALSTRCTLDAGKAASKTAQRPNKHENFTGFHPTLSTADISWKPCSSVFTWRGHQLKMSLQNDGFRKCAHETETCGGTMRNVEQRSVQIREGSTWETARAHPLYTFAVAIMACLRWRMWEHLRIV